jgi:hypothetical protein
MVCKAGMVLCKVIIAVPTILIGWLIFVILLYSCYTNNILALFQPGITIPRGCMTTSEGRFYESYLCFTEKPNFLQSTDKTSPDLPESINAYLELMKQDKNDPRLQNNPELKHIDRVFPIKSEGQEWWLVVRTGSPEGLFLLDSQFDVVEKADIYGYSFQYFLSATFPNKIWLQTVWGTIGYVEMIEVSIKQGKIITKQIGEGADGCFGYCYPTYKIVNIHSNPRMIIQRRKVPFLW